MKTLVALLALALPALANPCNTVCATPVVQTVVATPTVILPLYGAGYVGTPAGDDETKDLLRQLLAETKALREATVAPRAQARTNPDEVFAILRSNCVSCHGPTKPKGGFSLVAADGKFRPLSGPDRKTILARIDGKGGPVMPPPGNGADGRPRHVLTASEKAAISTAMSDDETPLPTAPMLPPPPVAPPVEAKPIPPKIPPPAPSPPFSIGDVVRSKGTTGPDYTVKAVGVDVLFVVDDKGGIGMMAISGVEVRPK